MSNTPGEWTLADAKLVLPEEFQKILELAKAKAEADPAWVKVYKWIAIAVSTGWRLSEVGHIEKDDVLSKRVIVTRRKKRTLHPAPLEVMPAIHALIHEQASKVEGGYIFPGNAKPCLIYRSRTDKVTKERKQWVEQVCVGGHTSLRTIQRAWRILVTELHMYMHGRGIHTARHTAITEMYRLTKDLRKCQVFAGHSSSKTTEIYAHICDLEDDLAKMKPLF